MIFILFYFLQQDSKDEPFESISTIPQQQSEQLNNENEEQPIVNIMVDVKGEVYFPGVYELTTEDRVIDAINLAGGYTEQAETKHVNHAQKLQDEMVIYIPKKGEELENQPIESIVMSGQVSNDTSDKININTADESQLTTLPGIGPSKAQAIIAYREENGSFKTIEDLTNVSGIGDKTFEKLKELIDIK
ncbi:helix-hairpin-helix domain-containing protein [Ureibacillus xyleni]|uniref:helix-hairpin-helix domain-containing protein n=1 Tax=Ureibacillus xyleni TaxID=614648 RepID=UPI001F316A0C|nr:helix-hairpin-helix domain-containing protein [Ureibacillus xyleni]